MLFMYILYLNMVEKGLAVLLEVNAATFCAVLRF